MGFCEVLETFDHYQFFSTFMKLFGLFIGITMIVSIAMAGSFYWDSFVISPKQDALSNEFVVQEGMGVAQIGSALEQQNIITSAFFFKIYVKLFHPNNALQAGRFSFQEGSNIATIVAALTQAEAIEVEVTIPEGWSSAQIGERLDEKLPGVSAKDFATISGPQGKLIVAGQDILSGIPSGQGLEGYLFPDTYRFRENADAKTVVDTMVITLKRRLAQQGMVVPENLTFENGMTLHEILTLASIVEREVRSPEDMKKIAGIFLTRLNIGMALQADSTVNYLTGKKDAAVSLEDSRTDSPYNTYKQLGLPPGPISNPGMNAIMAVMDPVDSDALYFLTTKDGQVMYADTFAQHVKNKQKYLY